MCIAIVSDHGVPLPDRATLKRCWIDNPDGAGYAYLCEHKGEHKWAVRKGLMTWTDFIEAFEAENFNEKHSVAIHFRVGTSGRTPAKNGKEVAAACTHPFPISDSHEELDKTEFISRNIIMHNGVVGTGEGMLSDTQVAIRDYASPLWEHAETNDKILKILDQLLDAGMRYKGSRWWVGYGSSMHFFGGWVQDENGIKYSHDGYKEKAIDRTYHGATYGSYEDLMMAYGVMLDTGVSHTYKSEVKNFYDIEGVSYIKYLNASGEWSWDLWNSDFSLDEIKPTQQSQTSNVILLDPPNHKEDTDGGITEVFNSDGTQVVGLVDEFGNVIWDDIVSEAEIDALESKPLDETGQRIPCSSCGASDLLESELNDGHCPYCSALLVVQESENVKCPNCGETRYLCDSSFDQGDTECLRCGAVFLDTIAGKDAIVCWNEDCKKWYDEQHLNEDTNTGGK